MSDEVSTKTHGYNEILDYLLTKVHELEDKLSSKHDDSAGKHSSDDAGEAETGTNTTTTVPATNESAPPN